MKCIGNGFWLIVVSLLAVMFVADTSMSDTTNRSSWTHDEKNNEFATYSNPVYGQIRFRIPAGWKSKFVKTPSTGAETIIFVPISGNSFQFLVDPLVYGDSMSESQDQERIKKQVEQLGNRFLPYAVETKINIKEARGRGNGYYFSITDKAPKPGEWEVMTQGGIGTGIYLLHFTVLTHSLDAKEIQDSIQMLTSAEYIKADINAVSEFPQFSDGKYVMSADGANWSLQFSQAGFKLLQSKFRNEGRSRYFHFSDKDNVNISFFIEPANSCSTSMECRKRQHDEPSGSMKVAKYIKDYEIGDFAVVEFFLEKAGNDLIRLIPDLKDRTINQGNINAHYVKNGYWIDVHISKFDFTDSDRLIFENIIRSLVFVDK